MAYRLYGLPEGAYFPSSISLYRFPINFYHDRDEAPVTRMATAAIIRENLRKAVEYGEKMDRAAQDEDADRPHPPPPAGGAPDFPASCWPAPAWTGPPGRGR